MLGFVTTGVMASDNGCYECLLCAAERSGEKFWRMPDDAEYETLIESDYADVRNTSKDGCGVKKWNIQEIHDKTGIVVFHTTGRKGVLDSGMRYRKQTVAMGLPSLSEYELWQTDEEEFRACAQIVHSLAAGAGQ